MNGTYLRMNKDWMIHRQMKRRMCLARKFLWRKSANGEIIHQMKITQETEEREEVNVRKRKHVEKYVEKHVEKYVEKYVEKHVGKHVEKYVEKYVEKCN
tara:strand:- start:752 stop:1048 length:297 start_codon:yes stop_codon:yes gene_type:complete